MFVLGAYYPNPSMNGIAAMNLVKVIKSIDTSICCHVLSIKQNTRSFYEEENIGRLHFVNFPIYSLYLCFSKYKEYKAVKKIIFFVLFEIVRIISFCFRNINPLGINEIEGSLYYCEIKKIVKKYNIDKIILISSPFSTYKAGLKIKKVFNNVEVIAYQFDQFVLTSDQKIPKFIWEKRKEKRRKLIDKCADLFDDYFSFYKDLEYETDNRIKKIGLPLLVLKDYVQNTDRVDLPIKFVFAGSLNIGLREPKDAISLICSNHFENDFIVDFYHFGNCNGQIEYYRKQYPLIIRNHGQKSPEICYKAMSEADFLVSIGTFQGNQIAGKTFDYISQRKPILYFYYNEDDINAKILQKYSLAETIRINRSDDEANKKRISEFVNSIRGNTADRNEILQQFSAFTPEYIAHQILGLKNGNY